MNHPLAEALLARAKNRKLPPASIRFDYGRHDGKVSILEPYIGRSGWLTASVFTVESLDQAEDHLILAAATDDAQELDEETCTRVLSLPGKVISTVSSPPDDGILATVIKISAKLPSKGKSPNATLASSRLKPKNSTAGPMTSNLAWNARSGTSTARSRKPDGAATSALTLEEKLAGQKQIKALESQRNHKRRSAFDAQDEVDRQRGELIARIEGSYTENDLASMFRIRWSMS